jgi:predicted phosphatase
VISDQGSAVSILQENLETIMTNDLQLNAPKSKIQNPKSAIPFKLLILDGDHTLWWPVDEICCSDRTVDDREGWPHFTYHADATDRDLIHREDGVRFRLTPRARPTIEAVTAAGGRLAMASYNYAGNIDRALTAWGLRDHFAQIVAHWHSRKGEMLYEILEAEAAQGHPIDPAAALFVDDDPYGKYRRYAEGLGIRFLQMGVDIADLGDVLALQPTAAPKQPEHGDRPGG